jgi:hypothetical protein
LITLSFAAASPQTPGKPREVRRLYWELEKRSEVYVRLIPEDSAGGKPFVSLTFRAYFPGAAKRNPYNGLPEWPAGPPARVTLTAEPLPMVLIKALALSFQVDGTSVNLTPPGGRYRNIPCLVASGDCTPFGVEAGIDPALLSTLVEARTVEGLVLGFPVRLTKDDLAALGEFASRAGLAPGRPPDGHPAGRSSGRSSP